VNDKPTGSATDARRAREAQIDAAARAEMLRADGARTLGENLEQANTLIRAAFELAAGFERAQP
jgi:hypothetical protein